MCRKYYGACIVMPNCITFWGCNLVNMLRCFCFHFHPFAFLVGVTGEGGCSAFGGECTCLVCSVCLMCVGEGGGVVMAGIVCFGVGLVLLLLSEVWLRFGVFQRWILV